MDPELSLVSSVLSERRFALPSGISLVHHLFAGAAGQKGDFNAI